MGAATLISAASCNNGTNPDKCECPNGTTHIEPTNKNCCDGVDCDCINQYSVSLGAKIIIVKDKTRSVEKVAIQNALNLVESDFGSDSVIQYIKNSSTDVIMIVDNINSNYIVDSNIFSVSANYLRSHSPRDICDYVFLDVFIDMKNGNILGMNKYDSNIRLAKSEKLMDQFRMNKVALQVAKRSRFGVRTFGI
jgi:hypothetical protein